MAQIEKSPINLKLKALIKIRIFELQVCPFRRSEMYRQDSICNISRFSPLCSSFWKNVSSLFLMTWTYFCSAIDWNPELYNKIDTKSLKSLRYRFKRKTSRALKYQRIENLLYGYYIFRKASKLVLLSIYLFSLVSKDTFRPEHRWWVWVLLQLYFYCLKSFK